MRTTIKAALKSVLGKASVKMPWGARKVVFDSLMNRSGSLNVISDEAKILGFTGFIARGKWGEVQSSSSDKIILPHYARTGDWAENTHGAISAFFGKDGGTYLDIGANIGLTTLAVAMNPLVQCHAFEPDPENFHNLRDNVRHNAGHGNVTVHQLALMDQDGELLFGLASDGNLGDHRVIKGSTNRAVITVTGKRLDNLALNVQEPLAVKIDTQGAESAIILGGQETLGNAGLVVMEFCPYLIDQLGGNPDVISEFISRFKEVALVKGDSNSDIVFTKSVEACLNLMQFYRLNRMDESSYLDIYARK